jgi:hypothetical protein
VINYLAAAAQATGFGFDTQVSSFDWPSFIMMAGFIALHAVIPLIAGLIYADHWRTFLIWVSVLASASYALHAGQEMLNADSDVYNRLDTLTLIAVFTLAPAFGAATLGILIRKVRTARAAPEAQI